MLPIISEMRATIQLLTEKLNGLSLVLRGMQQNSVLNIDQNLTDKEDEPHLEKFAKFELPIVNTNDLETLETNLKTDESFHIFFCKSFLSVRFYFRNFNDNYFRRSIDWSPLSVIYISHAD